MSESAAVESQRLQCVTFTLADESYAINVMQVQEVLKYTEIAPVPGAPPYVLGIINLRGNVVAVMDARSRFGLMPHDITDSTRIVVIEANEQVIGILVDSVAEVVELNSADIEPAPNVGNDESSKYIKGVANHQNDLIILVDLNKLLSEDEWMDLAQL